MARGRFYVVGSGGEITAVTGYKYPLSTSKGDLIDVGLYRPEWARCWYVIERTTGLYICTGRTKNDALSNATHKADAVYNLMTEADKNPESAQIVQALESCGAQVFLTRNGNVRITSDGDFLAVLQ